MPAYNLVHMRSPGVPFHAKGVGNGYILTFGDKRIYIAGDTENIPEMKGLGRIDVVAGDKPVDEPRDVPDGVVEERVLQARAVGAQDGVGVN